MAHHQRGPAVARDEVRHGEGFPGTGHTEQSLVLVPRLQGFREFLDGLVLVTLGLVFAGETERHANGKMGLLRDISSGEIRAHCGKPSPAVIPMRANPFVAPSGTGRRDVTFSHTALSPACSAGKSSVVVITSADVHVPSSVSENRG